MKVEITRDYTAFDPLVLIPPELQREHVLRRGHLIKETLSVDLNIAFRLINEIEELEAWKLAEETRESFFRCICGIDPEDELRRLRDGFAIMRGKGIAGPITADQVLGKPGEYGRGRPKPTEDDRACNDTSSKYGTAEHWKLRLARDRPDLAERVARGELSANAAAITAGFRKKSIPKPLTELRRAWKHASPEDRAAFRAEIADDEMIIRNIGFAA